jgi:hypothetical protein
MSSVGIYGLGPFFFYNKRIKSPLINAKELCVYPYGYLRRISTDLNGGIYVHHLRSR